MWGKSNPPFMQIIHFMNGLGAFIAPFLGNFLLFSIELNLNEIINFYYLQFFKVEPFLTLNPDDDSLKLSNATSFETTTTLPDKLISFTNLTSNNITGIQVTADDIRIKWPFIISGIFYIVCLLPFALFYFFFPDNSVHPSRLENENEMDSNKKKDAFHLNRPLVGCLKIAVIIIATFSMHAYVGK